jgi:hypothetical protein
MIGTLILQQLGGTNNNVRKLLIAYLLAIGMVMVTVMEMETMVDDGLGC